MTTEGLLRATSLSTTEEKLASGKNMQGSLTEPYALQVFKRAPVSLFSVTKLQCCSRYTTPLPRRDSKSPSRKYQEQTRQIWNSFKTNMLPSTKKQQHFIQMAVFQRLKAAQSCNSKQIFLPRNPPRMQRCTRLSSQPRVQKQAPAPTDNPQG